MPGRPSRLVGKANGYERAVLLGLLDTRAKSDSPPRPPASSRSEPYPKPKFPVAKFPVGTEEERRAYFRNALMKNSVLGWKAPPPQLVDENSIDAVMKYMDETYPVASAAAKQASAEMPDPYPIPGPPSFPPPPTTPNPARQASTAAPRAEAEDKAILASIAEAEECRQEWLEIQGQLKAEQAEAERQAEEGRQPLPSQADAFAAACEANAQAGDNVQLTWAEEQANELCGGMVFDSREDMLDYLKFISHQGNGEAEAVRAELLRGELASASAAVPSPATPPGLAAPTTPKPLYLEKQESEETLKFASPQSFDYDRVHAPVHMQGAGVSPAQGSLSPAQGSASLPGEISLADGSSLPDIDVSPLQRSPQGSPEVFGNYLKRARTQGPEQSFDMAKDDSDTERDTLQAADSLEAELNAMCPDPDALGVYLAVQDALRPTTKLFPNGYAGLAHNLPTLPENLQWRQAFFVPELFVIESTGCPLPSDQGHWLAKQDQWSFPEQCAWKVLMDSYTYQGDIMIHTTCPESLPAPQGYIWNRLPPLKQYYVQGGGRTAKDHFDRLPTHRLELQ